MNPEMILSEPDLTFESFLSLTQAMKSTNKNLQDLQTKAGESCNAVRTGGSEHMEGKRQS